MARFDGIKFSRAARNRLAQLGLFVEQIDALDSILGLDSVTLAIERDKPTMTQVRDELQALGRALTGANQQLWRLEDFDETKRGHQPRAHASVRLLMSVLESTGENLIDSPDGEHILSARPFAELRKRIVECEAIVSAAIASLPKSPVRHRIANAVVIERIVRALEHGFARQRADYIRTTDSAQYRPIGTYNFKVSESPTSDFFKIVSECFAASGRRRQDPTRAIRAFTSARRAKRHQRNVSEVSDVPS